MEHPCHKCGQAVEEGIPFCAHCGAPQIRVVIPEQQTMLAESDAESPPDLRDYTDHATVGAPVSSTSINWQQGLPAAAMAGGAAGLAMTLMGLFGVWMTVAGFFSIVFYRQRTRGSVLVPRAAARLGATSGILGFFLFSLMTVPTGLFRGMMTEMIKRTAERQADAQVQEMFKRWLEMLNTPQGLAFLLVCLLVVLIAASAIGGALGGAYLGRKRKP